MTKTAHAELGAFLEAIWGSGPHSLCWQTPGMSFAFTFVEQPSDVLAAVDDMQTANVWIGAHPLKGRPSFGRGNTDDVAAVAVLPVDLDWSHWTRKSDEALPSEAQVRERLARLGPELRPSIVVHSGHGLQPWWLLEQPVTPDVGADLLARLGARLAELELVNGRPDLASILRLPDTLNLKGGEAAPVVFEQLTVDARYTPEYLGRRLPAARAVLSIGAGGTRHRRGSVTDAQQRLHDHVVEHYGGHSTYVATDGSMHVTRPGKDAREGSSASIITGEQGDALLTVFSPTWVPIGPLSGEASRSWRLDGDELIRAYLDPLDGLTITPTAPPPIPTGSSSPIEPVPTIPLLGFETVPSPFVVPAQTWHAQALLSRPTHGEIAGPEKSLKSYTALALAVGLALGEPVLGRFDVPERQRVVLLVGEGGRSPWLRRLAAVCAAYGRETGDLDGWVTFTTQTASVASVRFLEGLRGQLEAVAPALVLLDPWYAYASSQVDSRQVTEVGASLELFGQVCREHGASALVCHHFNRNSEAPGLRRITGAGHAEWVDSWLMLKHRQPPQPTGGIYQLTLDVGSRQWGGDAYMLDYTIDPLAGSIRWNVTHVDEIPPAGEPDRVPINPLSDVKLELLRIGREHFATGGDPLMQTAWCGFIVKRRPSTVSAAFHELVARGEIVPVGSIRAGNNQIKPTYKVKDL